MPWKHIGECIDPHCLDLSISWRWVVSFTPLPLYPWGKRPQYPWIGGWVDPRASLEDVENRKFFTFPGLKLRPLNHPAHSQSLYRLSYPGGRQEKLLSICSTCHQLPKNMLKWNLSNELHVKDKMNIRNKNALNCT
jgi:hypothetical protein